MYTHNSVNVYVYFTCWSVPTSGTLPLLTFHHLPPRVGPGSKLEVALLVVKGEPGDVDLAGGLEEAGGHVEATAVTAHNHIRLVSPIEFLVRADCAN